MLPCRRRGPFDSCVDGQQGGAGDGVLQPGPGGGAQRFRSCGEAFVERVGLPPEGCCRRGLAEGARSHRLAQVSL